LSIEKRYEISFLFRRILVPIDGSENSFKALDLALDFAKRYGSKIHCVHVKRVNEDDKEIRELIERKSMEKRIHIEYEVLTYNPSESSVSSELIRYINEHGFDAVIIGARGRTLSEDINIGSTALSVVINAPITVIVVR
jgi:nucleotide-binding universal stress UspA family protein